MFNMFNLYFGMIDSPDSYVSAVLTGPSEWHIAPGNGRHGRMGQSPGL